MSIEILPESLLNGRSLHCQPVENGPIIEARVLKVTEDISPLIKKMIFCPARRPCSRCAVREMAGSEDKHCQYYKGDSLGLYNILGPNMEKKNDNPWKTNQ